MGSWVAFGLAPIPNIPWPRKERNGDETSAAGVEAGGRAVPPFARLTPTQAAAGSVRPLEERRGLWESAAPLRLPAIRDLPRVNIRHGPQLCLTPSGSGCRGRALILGRKQSACGLKPATPQARSS